MKSRVLILCLLCVVRASQVLSKEITEFGERTSVRDPSRKSTWGNDGADGRDAAKFRDKRALGLLLSGLAQIFGYTVTPVQLASLANSNMTTPAANSTAMGNMTGQQTASSRPMLMNVTVPTPRQQETIRFTGVVNFGNNSDIVGHLQRYERIFHGRGNNTGAAMTTSRPGTPMPKPAANLPVNPRTRPPLLTPFFVKIPLPIAPDLLPATMPIQDLQLSYPVPLITVASESGEEATPELPVRKEQETVYRNSEDTERYVVEEKEIYDEKDVMKPVSKYTHQLYVDEPSLSKQQDERYNEVQRKQEEYIARMKVQEAQKHRDDHGREDEINERHGNREEEVADRDRDHASKYSSAEERRPAYDEAGEESAEGHEEREDQANRSNESSERPAEKEEGEKTERYPDYDDNDEPVKQYKQDDDDQPPPADFNKYVEMAYNQQLPIGDYFHEGNLEEIRDSYGEVLNNKKLEDDRLSGYFSMFKQPYVDAHQRVREPENVSQEDKREETSTEADGYDEHLKRIQKLREEYALPEPESKYEEYEINDESEANRNGRQEERDENRTVTKSKKPKTSRGKENIRSEEAKSQEEFDLVKYTPLIVPVRYIDANDRVEQASTQQLKYKESKKKSGNSQVPAKTDNVASKEKPTPVTASLPERPRQLHEGEHKEYQLWPPPFDYAFDNTERTNTIVPANPQSYPLNYYQHIVTNVADDDASIPSDQPAGYVVVVGNPVHPYRYPYNIYYFPKEAVNPQNQDHLNTEGTHPQQHQLHLPRRNADQLSAPAKPNPTEYITENHNETTRSTRNYYNQPQEAPADVLNRYKYAFGEYPSRVDELPNVAVRSHISNTENWSNRIYPSQPRGERVGQSPTTLAQLQNVASSNQNVQSTLSEGRRHPQPSRIRKSSQSENRGIRKARALPRHSGPRKKPFDDPQSAHDFFGFSKNDYSFDGESDDASKVAEENGENTKEPHVFVAPEPAAYHYNESTVKHIDEPENDTEKGVVREYRNKVATLRVSEQRRLTPNGPTHYVDFTRNI
ncbi:PREDICTED: uncharacterized protein LOC106745906 [Dinoponera quadriceps]|uniref:Uncharacterized protein LOC106745906 n=1 Tax=Dinoponera quadriceps TaxID=609295 RepID=A0A6P3XHG5_DINQU|nr:PREDICTED: uncharacterized protein LOC106745906 [Dinoponera quadriceps]